MGYAELIQLILGAAGNAQAGELSQQQLDILKKGLAQFDNIKLPGGKQMQAEQLGPTQGESLSSDPNDRLMEQQALDELLKRGRNGGMTAEDLGNLETASNSSESAAKAGEDRIRERMSNHGLGGGGSELAMSLANNQGAAQRAHETSIRSAGDASKRAMDSILQGGRLAGQLRGENYDEAAKRAGAADARSRYNFEARQRANIYNQGLPQTEFENRLALASGRSGQANGLAGFYGQQAQNTREQMAGLGKAGSDLARAQQASYNSGATPTASSNSGVSAPPLVQANTPEDWENPYGGY